MQMTNEQVRFWLENAPSVPLSEFADWFDNDTDKIDMLIKSIKEEKVTMDEFKDDNYFEHGGWYYSSHDYVETANHEVYPAEDTTSCERCSDVVHNDDIRMHIGRRGSHNYYCEGCHEHEGMYYYDGEYYDYEGLEYHDLVVMGNGNIERSDDVYWDERSDEWVYELSADYVRDYHGGDVRQEEIEFTENPQYFVGLEIEKEDEGVRESLYIDDFESSCEGWRKEADGSLDSDTGFEVVSPPLELEPDKIRELIEGNRTLLSHVNAEYSTSCGGHIHLSERGLDGEALFKKIKGYLPLFHALYHRRVNHTYCRAKSARDTLYDQQRYQSVNILSNRIEIRIFSAVRDIANLHWRLRLLQAILSKPTACPKIAFYNIHAYMRPLLEEVYRGEEFYTLNERIINMTDNFEGVALINPIKPDEV